MVLACAFAVPGVAEADLAFSPGSGSPITDTGQGGLVRPVDLDDDGLDDLAIGSSTSATGGVRIRMAGANGGWTSKATLLAGSPIGEIVPEDFNEDGDQDLLVQVPGTTPSTNDQFQVFPGNGDGSFGAPVNIELSAGKVINAPASGQSIAPADIDGDGDLDLFVALAHGQVGVAAGNGDGTFGVLGAEVIFPDAPTGEHEGFSGILTGDFNGDAHTDFAFTLAGNPTEGSTDENSGFFVMYGQGGASYSEAVLIGMTEPYGPIWKSVSGDFNDDGSKDLVIATSPDDGGSTRLVLYPGGASGFATLPTTLFTLPGFATRVFGADFNRDGTSDLGWIERATTGNPRANNLVVATGNGSGGFTRQSKVFDLNFAANQDAVSSSNPGDFNGDGSPDIATSFSSGSCAVNACGVSVLLNRPVISVAPAALDFGTALQGSSVAGKSFTISNTGGAPTSLGTFALSSTEPVPFTVTNQCGEIPVGGTCSPQVSFNTANPGSYAGTLIYSFDGVAGDFRVNLSGKVTALTYRAGLKLTGPKKFTAGKKVKVTATITNLGTANLDRVALKWKAAQAGKTRAQGQAKLATIAADKKLVRVITLTIPKKKLVRGKPVKVTVTASRDGRGTTGDRFHVKQEFSMSVTVRR